MRSFLFGGVIAFGLAIFRIFPQTFYYEFQYRFLIELIFIILLVLSMLMIKRASIWLIDFVFFQPPAHLWMPIHVAFATLFIVLLGITLPFLSLSFYTAVFFGLHSLALFIMNDIVSKEMEQEEYRRMYGENNHIGGDLRRY